MQQNLKAKVAELHMNLPSSRGTENSKVELQKNFGLHPEKVHTRKIQKQIIQTLTKNQVETSKNRIEERWNLWI